jgi:hypothetical protein
MFTTLRLSLILLVLAAALSGCATSPVGVDEERIREKIQVLPDAALRSQSKLYRSAKVAGFAVGPNGHMLDVDIFLAWADNVAPSAPRYRIVVSYRTHGEVGGSQTAVTLFYDEWLRAARVGEQHSIRALNSAGATNWWTEEYVLPTARVEAALNDGVPVRLIIGNPYGTVGWNSVIPAQAIAAFAEGLRARGLTTTPTKQ